MEDKKAILSVKDLEVKFRVRGRVLTSIRNISLDIYENESIAIVGESGSGKSVFTKTFAGMLEKNGFISKGDIIFSEPGQEPVNLAKINSEKDWEKIRGKKVATVFQDPMTSLNPIITIGKQITSIIIKHQNCSEGEARVKAIELMEKVGIPNAEKRFDDYPFEYSGGMRQRIVIAIALACQPRILICDEPTTALDVTIQAQILRLIKKLQKEFKFTIVFITHDLGVVANIAERVAVMYAGQIVEVGSVEDIFYEPKHPYTWALLQALPQFATKGEELYSIKGTPPSLYNEIKGDAFAPRNPYCMMIDTVKEPPMFKVSETHYAKTWLLDENAPDFEVPEVIKNIKTLSRKYYGLESDGQSVKLVDEGNSQKAENVLTHEENGQSIENVPTVEEGGQNSEATLNCQEYAKDKEVLVSLKNVDITFGKGKNAFKAVSNVSFDIYKGETFSLVGESGSGKTTIGRAVIRVNPTSAGEILFKGTKINGKISHKLDREVIRNIQMIFQDPAASLNERATVDYIISEGLDNFKLYENKEDREQKIENMIKEVGLLPEHLTRYPHEFSGGQRQRIGVARAMIMEPELVVADEPISALDVSIRAQVLNLLKKFQREKNITYLFIAHDLSVVRYISDRIAVIYKGNIVEIAPTEELFNFPLHPYTRSLISAIPVPDPNVEKNKKLYVYDPSIHDYSNEKPELTDIGNNHLVYGSKKEIEEYKLIRQKNEKINVFNTTSGAADSHEMDNVSVSEEFMKRPTGDSGSIWFTIISFLLPLVGLVLMVIYKKKNYARNYEACKKGTLNFLGFAGLVILLLALLVAVVALR